jgi:hypothetical protein
VGYCTPDSCVISLVDSVAVLVVCAYCLCLLPVDCDLLPWSVCLFLDLPVGMFTGFVALLLIGLMLGFEL